ncbi:hypothetical protein [Effusibacillus lacus]|nr:hypothetical protein [Effusibacillus lacus]
MRCRYLTRNGLVRRNKNMRCRYLTRNGLVRRNNGTQYRYYEPVAALGVT